MIKIIAAMTPARVIGNKGGLPWGSKDVPGELAWFQNATQGHAVIMGRSTWDSLPLKYRPLPQRENIIVSRTMRESPSSEVCVARSCHEAYNLVTAGKDTWVIGGAQLYASALLSVSELYLTMLECEFVGDTFFPPFEHMFVFTECVRSGQGWTVKKFVRR